MFIDFLWDVFGMSLGDKIFAIVTGLGCLLVINGLILSTTYYRKARKLIQSKLSALPMDTDSLLSLRKEALRNRKSNLDSMAQYLACNWKLFEKIDNLAADERVSASSFSINSSFGVYIWLSPLEVFPKLNQTASIGIKALILGQVILTIAVPGSIVGGIVMISAFAFNAVIAARYEAILNSIKPQSSKAA